MFRIRRDPKTGLAIGQMRERFDRDEIIAAVREAYHRGDLLARENRLTIIEPGIRLDLVPMSDLAAIQADVARIETETASWSPLVSVFCGPGATIQLALDLYEMLWEDEPYVQGRFFHTESLVVAEQLLGVSGLPKMIAEVFADTPPG